MPLATLYGIQSHGIFGNEAGPGTQEVSFVKQDLQYVSPLGTVTAAGAKQAPMLALGETAVLGLAQKPAAADTLATFSDGSPALFRRSHGDGTAIVCAFHLGFSYFRPALPKRPVLQTLRLLLISYQDYHLFMLIELRKALISYQDYHVLLLTLADQSIAAPRMKTSTTSFQRSFTRGSAT